MDRDRIAGAAKEIKGSVEETIGKAVGDARLQSDGKAGRRQGPERYRRSQGRNEEVRNAVRLSTCANQGEDD